MAESSRHKGAEWRVGLWLARHPQLAAVPTGVGVTVAELGATTTGGLAAGALGAGVAWYRGHPGSFDRFAAPRLRSARRRWLSRAYLGPWWRDLMSATGLVSQHRRTGEVRFPRVLRVRAISPSIDVVTVRLVPGQHVRQWEQVLPEVTDGLRAERVAVERVRPQVISLIVQRTEPFTEIIDAPDMPFDSDAVDLSNLYLGETEYGADWCEPLLGQHWLVAGAMGAGKNSLSWSPLRDMAPMIRDGLVRVRMVDPKHQELSLGRGMAYR